MNSFDAPLTLSFFTLFEADAALARSCAVKEQAMTAHKCDYCRGPLGLIAARYWGMRFCSKAHKKAYQRRLAEVTRARIRHLVHLPHRS